MLTIWQLDPDKTALALIDSLWLTSLALEMRRQPSIYQKYTSYSSLVIKAISQSSSQLHPLSSIPQDKLPWHKVWRIWHKETFHSTVKSPWVLPCVTDGCCLPVSWQTLLDHLGFRKYGILVKLNSFLTGKFTQQQIKWWTFTMENIKKDEKLRYRRGQKADLYDLRKQE